MDEDLPREPLDLLLSNLGKQDLYDASVEDLQARIAALKSEIVRCEEAIGARADTRSAADKLFNL